jgi:hypothetical protein
MSISDRFVRRGAGLAALLATFFAGAALAAPPAAPHVTVSADVKLLNFDWDIVPRSNYYEFWLKANDGAPYVKFGESPAWRAHAENTIAAHLLDWDQARYQVKACNPSGCNASAPIGVRALMSDTIGYFKPSSLHNTARFGLVTAISEDGNTLAAFTAGETTPAYPKAAVYVFTKVDGQWRQQARLFPQSGDPEWENIGLKSEYYASLSLSTDGNRNAAGRLKTGAIWLY